MSHSNTNNGLPLISSSVFIFTPVFSPVHYIGDEVAKWIAEALRKGTTITNLYLWPNAAHKHGTLQFTSQTIVDSIEDETCRGVGRGLKTNTSPTELNPEFTRAIQTHPPSPHYPCHILES